MAIATRALCLVVSFLSEFSLPGLFMLLALVRFVPDGATPVGVRCHWLAACRRSPRGEFLGPRCVRSDCVGGWARGAVSKARGGSFRGCTYFNSRATGSQGGCDAAGSVGHRVFHVGDCLREPVFSRDRWAMKRLLVALFVSLVLLQSYATAAEDVCYQYQFGSDGWVNSAAEAVAQVQHYCTVTDAAASPHTCAGGVFGTCTYSGFVDAGFISGAEHINYNYSCNGGSTFSFHQNVARRVNPAGCPPDPCSSVATTANALGGSVRNGSGDTSGTFCGEVLGNSDADIHHCEATVVGVVTKSGDNWAAQMHWSGRSCDAAPGAGGPDVAERMLRTA